MARSQSGGITRISKDVYRISIEGHKKPDGSRTRINLTVRGNRQEALKQLALLKIQNNQPSIAAGKVTVRDFFNEVYLPDMEKLMDSERLARSTYYKYESHIRLYIAPSPFGDTALDALTVRGIKQWAQAIEKPGAARSAWKTFRQGINYAMDDCEILDTNPLPKEIKLRKCKKYEPEVYTVDEAKGVLSAFKGNELEPWLLVALGCGLSRSEGTALFWQDINLDNGLVIINKSWQYLRGECYECPTKNNNRTRICVLPESIRLRLIEIAGTRIFYDGERIADNPCGCLVPDKLKPSKRRNPDIVAKDFKRACKDLGVKYIPANNLRHSFATIATLGNADSAMLSRAMGHSNLDMKYKHYVQDQIGQSRQVANVLDSLLM